MPLSLPYRCLSIGRGDASSLRGGLRQAYSLPFPLSRAGRAGGVSDRRIAPFGTGDECGGRFARAKADNDPSPIRSFADAGRGVASLSSWERRSGALSASASRRQARFAGGPAQGGPALQRPGKRLPQGRSMTRSSPRGNARDLIPPQPTITRLRQAAAACTACPLYRNATQTVFGEGPEQAPVMLV